MTAYFVNNKADSWVFRFKWISLFNSFNEIYTELIGYLEKRYKKGRLRTTNKKLIYFC